MRSLRRQLEGTEARRLAAELAQRAYLARDERIFAPPAAR